MNQAQWMKVNLKQNTSQQMDRYLSIEQPFTMTNQSSIKEEQFDFDLLSNL